MLIYHSESDSLFWEDDFDFEAGADAGLCADVSDQPWAIERARAENIVPDAYKPIFGIADDDDFMAVPGLGHNNGPALDDKAKGMSGAIAAAMHKWARKPADLYPTPIDCTYSLLPHVAHLLPRKARIWEPACADGQMVQPLREFGYNVMGTDLRPDVKGGAGGVDFLEPTSAYHSQVYDGVFTNPPFGIAEQFIRRALEEAPVAVMLLKAQYWNTKGRKKLFRETKPLMELNLTWRPAFLAEERGNSPLMDCMWVVWQRGHQGSCTTTMIDRVMTCPPNMDFGGL